MNRCKYYDCGYCYAPDDVETSASSQSACFDPDYCPYLKSQTNEIMKNDEILKALDVKIKLSEESLMYLRQCKSGLEGVIRNHSKPDPVQYEKPMNDKEQIKIQIKKLQEELYQLEEIEKESQMILKNSGSNCDVVYYNQKYYYRMGFSATGCSWWKREIGGCNLYLVDDPETKTKLEQLYEDMILDTAGVVETEQGTWNYDPDAKFRKQEEPEEQKENEWKSVALRFGEKLVSVGPCGYYDFTPDDWYEWAVNTYEKLADDWLNLLKKEKQVKKLQDKEWEVKVETDYLTGKPRHKTRIVDKDGNDCKPEPLTTEELLSPNPSILEQLEGAKTDVEKAYKRIFGYYPNDNSDKVSWIAFQKGYEEGKHHLPTTQEQYLEKLQRLNKELGNNL